MRITSFLVGSLFLFISHGVFAADVPGGVTRNAEGLPNNTYEVGLSPSYTMDPTGMYLSSDIRYQPNEDFGAGFGFGAGEVGFNFGVNGTWYILPDTKSQPAFSVVGGLYFNRLQDLNYFDVKVTPLFSKTVRFDGGKISPYAGVSLTPSFRLSQADNQLAVRTATGAQLDLQSLAGLKLFAEFDLGLINSVHEALVGISYPFVALGM